MPRAILAEGDVANESELVSGSAPSLRTLTRAACRRLSTPGTLTWPGAGDPGAVLGGGKERAGRPRAGRGAAVGAGSGGISNYIARASFERYSLLKLAEPILASMSTVQGRICLCSTVARPTSQQIESLFV